MSKTESMMERVAKAIYEGRNGPGCKAWGSLTKAHQTPYIADAHVAIHEMADENPAKVFWQDWARKRLEISRSQWVRAGKRALAGDLRDIRLRIELAEAPPVAIVCSDAALSEEGK